MGKQKKIRLIVTTSQAKKLIKDLKNGAITIKGGDLVKVLNCSDRLKNY